MADKRAKGAITSAKGAAKEAAGKLTADRKLEAKGTAQKAQGKAQGVVAKPVPGRRAPD